MFYRLNLPDLAAVYFERFPPRKPKETLSRSRADKYV
jgi:hypothetical protein